MLCPETSLLAAVYNLLRLVFASLLNLIVLDGNDDQEAKARAGREGAAAVLDRCLGEVPADEARRLFLDACAALPVGGLLFVHDLAAVPESLVLGLLRLIFLELPCKLLGFFVKDLPRPAAAHDLLAWLPDDIRMEARRPSGWLHETTVLRRLASRAGGAAGRLRRMHGETSMAYCASPDANRVGGPERQIRYFFLEERGGAEGDVAELGYVAYTEHALLGARVRLVVMDPVCPAARRHDLVGAFLADCRACRARPVFACVSSGFTAPLQDFGFHTTKLGGEVGIELANFCMPKERCRYLRSGPAKGLECHRECFDFEELHELNSEWLCSKGMGAEMGIWTYPPSMPQQLAAEGAADRDEVRRLFTYQDGQLVGFVCAEPFYKGDGSGEILGYGLNTIRFLAKDGAPAWASDFSVATLIRELQAEGKATYLAFGLSPWTELTAVSGELLWLRCLFQAIWYANVESFYSIRGLAKKKQHHCAKQGVKLHDRFIAGVPLYALPDTVRFTILLFGENLARVPGGLCLLLGSQACKLCSLLSQRRSSSR